MRRSAVLIATFGAALYFASLVATIPARFAAHWVSLPPRGTDVSGTLWNGTAAFAGAHVVSWHVAPLRSLANVAFAADWSMRGAGTQLEGRALLRSNQITLENVRGNLGWPLIESVIPALSAQCNLNARVLIPHLAFGDRDNGVVGELRTAPGGCETANHNSSSPVEVPALLITSTKGSMGSRFRLNTIAQPALTLGDGSLTSGRVLTLRLLPAGLALLSRANVSSPVTLEMKL